MPYKDPQAKKDNARKYRERKKESMKAYQDEYRATHDFTEYKREWHARKRFDKYGITKDDFELMLSNQKGLCDICDTPFNEQTRPYIDHCHDTGQVRGLLCMNCNTGLGHFRDNQLLLNKAIEYLNK